MRGTWRALHEDGVHPVHELKRQRLSTTCADFIQPELEGLDIAFGNRDIRRLTIRAQGDLIREDVPEPGLGAFDLGALNRLAARQSPGQQVRIGPVRDVTLKLSERAGCRCQET